MAPGHSEGTGELEVDDDTVGEGRMKVVVSDVDVSLEVMPVSVLVDSELVELSADELVDISAGELVERSELDSWLLASVVVVWPISMVEDVVTGMDVIVLADVEVPTFVSVLEITDEEELALWETLAALVGLSTVVLTDDGLVVVVEIAPISLMLVEAVDCERRLLELIVPDVVVVSRIDVPLLVGEIEVDWSELVNS